MPPPLGTTDQVPSHRAAIPNAISRAAYDAWMTSPRRRRSAVVLVVAAFVASSCGGSTTVAKDTTTSTTSASGSAGNSTTVPAAASSGGNAGDFCAKLTDELDKSKALAASVGTPAQAAALAEIETANASIVAAAPPELHDTMIKINEMSAAARNALTATPADRAAAAKAAAATVSDPAVKAATATYTAWVTTNCGASATAILNGGR